jgi:hypothetical protein
MKYLFIRACRSNQSAIIASIEIGEGSCSREEAKSAGSLRRGVVFSRAVRGSIPTGVADATAVEPGVSVGDMTAFTVETSESWTWAELGQRHGKSRRPHRAQVPVPCSDGEATQRI